jgi:hypothetical protein
MVERDGPINLDSFLVFHRLSEWLRLLGMLSRTKVEVDGRCHERGFLSWKGQRRRTAAPSTYTHTQHGTHRRHRRSSPRKGPGEPLSPAHRHLDRHRPAHRSAPSSGQRVLQEREMGRSDRYGIGHRVTSSMSTGTDAGGTSTQVIIQRHLSSIPQIQHRFLTDPKRILNSRSESIWFIRPTSFQAFNNDSAISSPHPPTDQMVRRNQRLYLRPLNPR